jgi:hypothetical protein
MPRAAPELESVASPCEQQFVRFNTRERLEDREQIAESREQRAESKREESREQRAESREQEGRGERGQLTKVRSAAMPMKPAMNRGNRVVKGTFFALSAASPPSRCMRLCKAPSG